MGKPKIGKGKGTSMDIRTYKESQKVGKGSGTSASLVYRRKKVQKLTLSSKTLQLGQVACNVRDSCVDSPHSQSDSQFAEDDNAPEYVDSPHSPVDSPQSPVDPPNSPDDSLYYFRGSLYYRARDFNEEKHLQESRVYAGIALDHYNRKHHTNYEVVEGREDLHSFMFFCYDVCIHCNFRAAKPNKITCGEGSSSTKATTLHKSSSTKLFFAELCRVSLNKSEVTCCCILKGGEAFPSCTKCDDRLKHPISGFRAGWNHYKPYNLRSRLDNESESTQNSKQLQLSQFAEDDNAPEYVDSPHSPVDSPQSPVDSPYSPDDSLYYFRGSLYYRAKDFDEEKHLQESRVHAGIALDYYNRKHHTNYEVVEGREDLHSFMFFSYDVCIHCNFRAAQPNKITCGEGSSSTKATTLHESSSTELFFAELCRVSLNKSEVTCCCILKGGEAFPSCTKCDDSVKHPTSGFRASWNHTPESLRSRPNKELESTQNSKQLQLSEDVEDDNAPGYGDSPRSPCESIPTTKSCCDD